MSIWKGTPCTFHVKCNSTTKYSSTIGIKRTKISTTNCVSYHTTFIIYSHWGLRLWLVRASL